MNKHYSSNINRTFAQSYLVFNNETHLFYIDSKCVFLHESALLFKISRLVWFKKKEKNDF